MLIILWGIRICFTDLINSSLSMQQLTDNNISDVRPIFDSLYWTEESYRMLEKIGQTGKQWQICSAPTTDVSSFLLIRPVFSGLVTYLYM